MNRIRTLIPAVVILAVTAPRALATEIGDTAPALKVAEWVKGDKVDLKAGQGKNVYVIEFWATWCGPCRESIPHLTEMQAQFKDKDVVFVGVSDEPTSKVKPFVEKMGKKMDYVVACDDNKATGKAYMEAFGQGGIPHAFIINKAGKIVWHGHPMMGLDKVIDEILADKYDIEAFKKASNAAATMPKYFKAVTAGKSDDKTKAMGADIIKFCGKDAGMMNQFAWQLLTAPGIQHRDLKLALEAGQAAYAACEGKDAAIVDTYARALYDNGQKDDAIKMEKKAVELCKDENMAKELKAALKLYQSGKPTKPAGGAAMDDDDDDDDDKGDMKKAKGKDKDKDDDDDNG